MKSPSPITVADIIQKHVLAHRQSGTLSVAETARQVRLAFPDCWMTDEELCASIVIAAIERGCSISFDAPGGVIHPDAFVPVRPQARTRSSA